MPMRGDEVLIEIDGPGVTPDTVPSVHLIALASAYIDALMRVAEEEEEQLSLTGLDVLAKCAAVAVHVDQPRVAAQMGAQVERLVLVPDDAPRGLRREIGRLAATIAAIPPGLVPGVRHYDGETATILKLVVTRPAVVLPPHEIVSMRAKAVRAGGSRAVARFEARGEPKPFTLDADDGWDTIRRVGACLNRPVDLVARVYRDAEGAIAGGSIIEVSTPLADSKGAWERWYAENPGAMAEPQDDDE